MNPGRGKMGLMLAFAVGMIPFPLFMTTAGTVYRGGGFDRADVVPLGIAVVLALTVVLAWRWRGDISSVGLVSVFGAVGSLMVVGLWHAMIESSSDIMLLGVYVASMPALYVGVEISRRLGVAQAARPLMYGVGVVAVAHLATSFVTLGFSNSFFSFQRGADDLLGVVGLYQKLVYYPTLLGIGAVWFGFVPESGRGRWFFLAAILLDLVVVSAREPFLFCVCAGATFIVIRHKSARAYWIGALFLLVVLGSIYYAISYDTYLGNKVDDALLGIGDGYTAGRAEMISMFLAPMLEKPVFGWGFSVSEFGRLTPHNQFVELLYRVGVVGVLTCFSFLLVPLLVFVRRKWRCVANSDSIAAVLAILVAFLVVTSNVNTPMRAPYLACVVYFLLGSLIGDLSRIGGLSTSHTSRVNGLATGSMIN